MAGNLDESKRKGEPTWKEKRSLVCGIRIAVLCWSGRAVMYDRMLIQSREDVFLEEMDSSSVDTDAVIRRYRCTCQSHRQHWRNKQT